MDTVERRARLEARLRGGDVRLVSGRTDDYEIAVNMGGITEVFDATDPTTPEGSWEWLSLIARNGGYEIDMGRNCHKGHCVMVWTNNPVNVIEITDVPDPIAAVAAAVDALALKEFPDA